MSTQPKDGGPAFPSPSHVYLDEWDGCGKPPEFQRGAITGDGGMSLRDWFAGQALAGMPWSPSIRARQQAKECYEIADAMLAARERKEDAT